MTPQPKPETPKPCSRKHRCGCKPEPKPMVLTFPSVATNVAAGVNNTVTWTYIPPSPGLQAC